jgi:hypothetical protein
MKTSIIYISLFYLVLQLKINAQANRYQLDENVSNQLELKNGCDVLRPVYYNFSRRRLYTGNQMPLNGNRFLEMCRSLNDPGIQSQIRRYDQLTSNKRKLVGAMLICGIGGYVTMMGSLLAASNSYAYDRSPYIGMGIGAISLFIATPILAISTGIPHQKRKEVVFRDLPEAYNFYVTSQPK